MVKVIGTDTARVKRATCGDCASILEYTPSECRERTHKDISGATDVIAEITCPQCGGSVVVSRY